MRRSKQHVASLARAKKLRADAMFESAVRGVLDHAIDNGRTVRISILVGRVCRLVDCSYAQASSAVRAEIMRRGWTVERFEDRVGA